MTGAVPEAISIPSAWQRLNRAKARWGGEIGRENRPFSGIVDGDPTGALGGR
jgi:hypothetical protein